MELFINCVVLIMVLLSVVLIFIMKFLELLLVDRNPMLDLVNLIMNITKLLVVPIVMMLLIIVVIVIMQVLHVMMLMNTMEMIVVLIIVVVVLMCSQSKVNYFNGLIVDENVNIKDGAAQLK